MKSFQSSISVHTFHTTCYPKTNLHREFSSPKKNASPHEGSIHGWATETRSNSKYPAPRSIGAAGCRKRCECGTMFRTGSTNRVKKCKPTKLTYQNPPSIFDGFNKRVSWNFPWLSWLIPEGYINYFPRKCKKLPSPDASH